MSNSTVSAPLKFAGKDEMMAFVRTNLEGKMLPEKINLMTGGLGETSGTKYPGQGSVAGGLFVVSFKLECEGHIFSATAGGVGTLGGGPFTGDLYTDDLARCFRDTQSFSLTVTPVMVLATFHAADHKLLGTYLGGGYMAPALVFEGGGSGQWKNG